MKQAELQIKQTSTLKKAQLVVNILNEHYESGNQSKLIAGVLRTKISKVYPISYRTLLRYIKLVESHKASLETIN